MPMRRALMSDAHPSPEVFHFLFFTRSSIRLFSCSRWLVTYAKRVQNFHLLLRLFFSTHLFREQWLLCSVACVTRIPNSSSARTEHCVCTHTIYRMVDIQQKWTRCLIEIWLNCLPTFFFELGSGCGEFGIAVHNFIAINLICSEESQAPATCVPVAFCFLSRIFGFSSLLGVNGFALSNII